MQFLLTDAEQRTLIEMGIHHPNARARRRAQGLTWLARGSTCSELARDYQVHENSVRHWVACWQAKGIVGLFEGHRSGRPRKLPEKKLVPLRSAVKASPPMGRPLSPHYESGSASGSRDRVIARMSEQSA